jgi:hypothetical protein
MWQCRECDANKRVQSYKRTGGKSVELLKVDGSLAADGGKDGVAGVGERRGCGVGGSDEQDLLALTDESRGCDWGHGGLFVRESEC